jgi:dCMP deaminase
MQMNKWDDRFMRMAIEISQWSKDPSKKIGAVAVGENYRVLSTGYNGFPRSIEDSANRLNDRNQKYKYVVHAEQNCIYNACLNGISLAGASLYVYGLPVCSECAKGVIQVGIKKVIIDEKTFDMPKWNESFELSKQLFSEAGVEIKYVNVSQSMDEMRSEWPLQRTTGILTYR